MEAAFFEQKKTTMNLIFYTLLALLVNFQQATATRKRILGGHTVGLGEYPMVAQIFSYPEIAHICGAVIITHQNLLSAANCFETNSEIVFNNRKVLVGDVHRQNDAPPPFRQVVLIDDLILPPGYEEDKIDNNIVIVKLKWSIAFSEHVMPVRIGRDRPSVDTECTVCGWGMSEDHPNPPDLIAASIPIQDPEKCHSLKQYNEEYMICAGDESKENGTCYGDKGGPLICDDILSGLIYYGKHLCFGVAAYIDIAKFSSWIIEESSGQHRTLTKSGGSNLGCRRLFIASIVAQIYRKLYLQL